MQVTITELSGTVFSESEVAEAISGAASTYPSHAFRVRRLGDSDRHVIDAFNIVRTPCSGQIIKAEEKANA